MPFCLVSELMCRVLVQSTIPKSSSPVFCFKNVHMYLKSKICNLIFNFAKRGVTVCICIASHRIIHTYIQHIHSYNHAYVTYIHVWTCGLYIIRDKI